LAEILAPVSEKYDFVLIDCPPHIGLLTQNALRAATEVLIPVDTGYFSLQGLSKQLETIQAAQAGRQEPLEIRVLANLYDVRTKLGREILSELKRKFGPMMCHTFINFNTKLREGASFGQPITEYDPASMGYRDFVRLARELIAGAATETGPTTLLGQADQLVEQAERLLATSQPLFGRSEDGNGQPPGVSAEDIQRKIDNIYGVRATSDGILFTAHAPGASLVSLAGDFNNWSAEATPMKASDAGEAFQALLPLAPGRYCYRLVVDGEWRSDPHNSYVETNPFGELNSVVEVQ
jgi:chromosome partitioning protein